jgi:hypothetical protein
VRRGRVDGLAFVAGDVGIFLGVLFHPKRHIVIAAVLPGGEPEEDEMEVVCPCLCQQGVDEREIKFVLLGFELFPVDGGFEGIEVEIFCCQPCAGQQGGPGAGVVDLAAEDEVGFAIDQERVAAVVGDELGHGGLRGCSGRGDETYCEKKITGCHDLTGV